MTKFICIGGKAQNGKDTSAAMMQKTLSKKGYKVLITHYADLLKYMCKNYFGWNGEKDDAGRTLLQRVGTEGVRSQKPNFWVDFVIDIVDLFPNEWDYVIIPDTRFPNEINRIKSRGYESIYIRIRRLDFSSPLTEEQQNHPSEIALDTTAPDFTILNGTLDGLEQDIEHLCETIVAWSTINETVEQISLLESLSEE
jgi:hypothetical protein